MIDLFKRSVVLTWAFLIVVFGCLCAVVIMPFALVYLLWEEWHSPDDDDEDMFNAR